MSYMCWERDDASFIFLPGGTSVCGSCQRHIPRGVKDE